MGLIPLLFSYKFGGWVRRHTHNPSNFTFASIPDLTGRVAIVTGSNTGIGKVTARELARKGASVIVAARSPVRGQAAVDDIKREVGLKAKVEFMPLDLASLASIRTFAQQFKESQRPLHALVLNAGVMMCPFNTTKDGFEMQIGTNHLGHFLLTHLLLDTVIASAPSRIVVVSSMAHENPYEPEGIRFDQWTTDTGYSEMMAYGQSKLANVLMAKALARRLEGRRVFTNVCHPGVIVTELQRHLEDKLTAMGTLGSFIRFALEGLVGPGLMHADDGALTQLYLAAHPDVEAQGIHGQYFEPVAWATAPTAHALNETLQDILWDISETLVRVAKVPPRPKA
uniref:Uncharacterized protein n=1 Tax=Eutreptiella gymnastica TaxID=73025 RepID=A0A7S4LM61_9EUGL